MKMINKVSGFQFQNFEKNKSIQSSSISKNTLSPMGQDCFIKALEPSFIPTVYTNKDITNVANTTEVSEKEPLVLTKEQEFFYFGILSGDGYNDYIPLLNASDDVKRAWIKTLDALNEKQVKDDYPNILKAKESIAAACGFFSKNANGLIRIQDSGNIELLGGKGEYIENTSFGFYKNLINTSITEFRNMKNPYEGMIPGTLLADGNTVPEWGAQAEADFYQIVLDLFERNYAKEEVY